MKKLLLLLATVCCGMQASAVISVTPASGGTNICANLAVGGATPGFTTLSTITVSEGFQNDIATGNPRNLVLNLPTGWSFNTAVPPTLNFAAGRNIASIGFVGFTATSITITMNVTSFTQIDVFTIAGLQVRANSTASAAGNITTSTNTGFAGITATPAPGATNFGSLSLTPSLTPSVGMTVNPSTLICTGTTVTFTATPVNGGTPTYQWNRNGIPVVGATNTVFSTGTMADGDVISVVMGATGCVNPTFTSTNRTMTVNAIPAAVPVTGAGVFCETATITAGPSAGGTIYYQGTNINGTSTATPSTSQVITTPGSFTYYFRERAAAGCWGAPSPVKVRIDMPPTGITVTPASATLCMGDSATLVASGTAPNVEVFEEDFNSGTGSWTITNILGNATSFWQGRTPPGYQSATPGDGTPYAQAAPDATGSLGNITNTILTSSPFSLVNYTSATLTFNQFFRFWATGDIDVLVEVSPDGGASWITLANQLGANAGTTTWTPVTPSTTLALPPAVMGQPNVMVRFNYNSNWGFYWAVDNIKVNAVPVLSFDWAGVAGATGLSCTTCNTVTVTPAMSGANTYTVTSSVLGCAAGTSATVSVNALPTIYNVIGGGSYCAGDAGVPVDLDGSDAGVDYQLYNGATAMGAPVAGTGATFSFGSQTMVGTYTVMATDATTGCSQAMNDSAVVVMDTLPSAITGPTDVCEGSTITLASTTPGGTWASSTTTVATVGSSSGNVAGIAAGTSDITYTAATSCFVTQTVTVNALPVIAPITGVTTLCVGGSTTLSNATPGGVWFSADPSIASIDMLGAVNANAVGTTNISYAVTDMMGCTDTVSTGDTVISFPAAMAINPLTPTVTMCDGMPANLVMVGGSSGFTYQWSHGGVDIAGATNSSYTATVAGTYDVAVNNGICEITLSKTVVNPPVASIGFNTTGGYLFTGSFHAYQWFRNGVAVAGATSSVHMSPGSGNYFVVVYDANGCTDTSAIHTIAPTALVGSADVVANVKVFPNPAATQVHIEAPVKVTVTIASPDGRTVKANQATNTINISDLPNGAYMLLIYDEHNVLLKTERLSKIN